VRNSICNHALKFNIMEATQDNLVKAERIISLVSGGLMMMSALRRGRIIGLVTGGMMVHHGLAGISPQYREFVGRAMDQLFQSTDKALGKTEEQ